MLKFEFAAEAVLEEKAQTFAIAKEDAFAEKDVAHAEAAELEARRRAEANEAKWLDGAKTVLGTEKDDILFGSEANEVFIGLGGADHFHTGAGDDRIYGGKGQDLVDAGAGNDVAWTAEDDDRLFGGEGDDLLGGDEGNDDLAGGAGNDTLWGGADDDRLFGDAGDDLIGGDAGFRDHLYGGAGNDRLFDPDGVGFMSGDAGDDILGLTVGAGWGKGTYEGFVAGGEGNDSLFLTANDATLVWRDIFGDEAAAREGDGDDYVELLGRYAGANAKLNGGNDYFKGGVGADTVDGGAGHDWIDGGAGNDRLAGGAGWDRFIFANGSGRDAIVDFQNGIDVVDLSGYRDAKGEKLDFADLRISGSGTNAYISLPGGETIAFSSLSPKLLDETDFVF